MKKNLEILEIEAKLTKDEKKYWRVKTEQGWMSCFDVVAKDALGVQQLSSSGIACCEVTEKKGTNFRGEDTIFYNITKCYGEAEEPTRMRAENVGLIDEKPEVVKMSDVGFTKEAIEGAKKIANIGKYEPTTMYVSYAKDIFCATIQTEVGSAMSPDLVMKEAIILVKQAKEAFE